MCKFNPKNEGRRIDPCMKSLIKYLNKCSNLKVLACCCGHKKYPMSIIVEWMPTYRLDICSDIPIPRKKRFYARDKQGYYFIPEVIHGSC